MAKTKSSRSRKINWQRGLLLSFKVFVDPGRTLVGEYRGWVVFARNTPTDKFTHEAIRPAPESLFRAGREVLVCQSEPACISAIDRRVWREAELEKVVRRVRSAVRTSVLSPEVPRG